LDYLSRFKSPLLNNFISDNDFLLACNMFKQDLDYTYFHATLNQKSMVDYFLGSRSLFSKILDFKIIDNGGNLSDHLPIAIMVPCECTVLINDCNEAGNKSTSKKKKCLRWDHANLSEYYNKTYELTYPLYCEINNFDQTKFFCNNCSELKNDCDYCTDCTIKVNWFVNDMYTRFVHKLSEAAVNTIPVIEQNFFKFWWDLELTELKQKSYDSHTLWKKFGSPHIGPIFQLMTHNKLLYKQRVKEKQKIHNLT